MSGWFILNGERRSFDCPTHRTLLQWLRAEGLTGTKEGCAEGDCGACTVAMVERDTSGRATYRAVNSCLLLMPMVHGRELVSVEGLCERPTLDGLHPVQRAMVECYGSQCGYCTPGFVMSMFEAHYRSDLVQGTERKVADQLNGNLCRCTGYRPIRDAMMRALSPSPTDLFALRLAKDAPPLESLEYMHGEETFFRPTSMADLLALRARHPEAHLVAGATEIGVEINKKARAFPMLISTEGVAELRAVTRTSEAWRIGGAATLTEIEDALHGEIPAIDKMLWVFASRQIRSRATLAGNIVTASPIGDMPPLLLALDATVVLSSVRGERSVAIEDFFTAYRRTVLERDEVVTAILLPHPPPNVVRLTESYKVSKRRELDISIACAAFSIDRTGETIVRARLAYGGVTATPVRAKKTEAALIGRKLDLATLREVLPILDGETKPIDDVRGSKHFRAGLVTTLFEKLVSGESSEGQDAPLTFASHPIEPKADASRALAHESAVGHVTGSALYVDDEAPRNALVVWPVMSPHAHAKVLSIDTMRARNATGVRCVLTAEDVPGQNDVGAIRKDEPLFASGEVFFHGQIVAIVVGDSYEECRAAAALVRVEYEALPAILSIEAAIAQGSFHTQAHVIQRGDAGAALSSATDTLSGHIDIGGQEHFYLEAQAAWAECGDDGDVHVSSSTQHPSEIHAVVSHVLHLPRNRVVVSAPRMGGGFGGKETQGNTWAAIVALAAWKTRRPVRVQLDRDIDMMLTGKRHPFHAEYEVGFGNDGVLTALRARLVSDGGWALDLSESICDRALFHIDNAYFVPNVDVSGRVAKTNQVSHTAFRGFGGPQGMVIIEEALDRIARHLGIQPEIVRERNLYRGTGATCTTHYGQHIDHNRIGRIWPKLVSSSELESRRTAIEAWNAKSPRIKRGIAIVPVKFGISFTATYLNQAGALVLCYRDGTVQVNHGGTEMGQGLYTKVRGVAMRELGLPASAVRVMKTRTDKVPNTSATAASSGADLNGAAVRDACEKLRERLAPIAAAMIGQKSGRVPSATTIRFEDGFVFSLEHPETRFEFAAVCERAHAEQVSLAATGYYRTPGIGYDKAKGRGKPFYYFAFGAAVTEVEVDGYSGMKRVRRVDILHDVGDSLNDGVDRGQVEGGFVQGMGWLTGEELKWDANGRLLTHSASTYQIPSISDAPFDFRVALLPDAAQEGTIHGSKAVGEPPLMLAMSVREAIRDAIAAFGTPGGDVTLPCPATHEAIFFAIRARQERAPISAAAEE